MQNKNLKTKEKAFVLPSTIVAIVIISLVSFLMISLVAMSSTSNVFLINYSNKKILSEKIFRDFKNNNLTTYENVLVQTYTSSENENVSAVIATKNESTMFFGVYDFSKNEVVNYQISKFDFEFDENQNLIYGDLIFFKDENLEQINLCSKNLKENKNLKIINVLLNIKAQNKITKGNLWA